MGKTTWGSRIKTARTLMKLSQIAFAEKFGISVGSVANWEAGRAKPTTATVAKLTPLVFARATIEAEKAEAPHGRVRRGEKKGQPRSVPTIHVVREDRPSEVKSTRAQGPIFSADHFVETLSAVLVNDPTRREVAHLLTCAKDNGYTLERLLSLLGFPYPEAHLADE
jgi:transcriptional regulator with XRE-family HTH domain